MKVQIPVLFIYLHIKPLAGRTGKDSDNKEDEEVQIVFLEWDLERPPIVGFVF